MLLGVAIRAMATPARLRGRWHRLGYVYGFASEQLAAAQASRHGKIPRMILRANLYWRHMSCQFLPIFQVFKISAWLLGTDVACFFSSSQDVCWHHLVLRPAAPFYRFAAGSSAEEAFLGLRQLMSRPKAGETPWSIIFEWCIPNTGIILIGKRMKTVFWVALCHVFFGHPRAAENLHPQRFFGPARPPYMR